ncbi:18158_t:CDS:2, partial [Cetraspora pellucida]
SQQKHKLQQIEKQFKEAGFNIQLARPTIGCSSLEETQLGLYKAIIQIVSSDGQADEKRSSELFPKRHSSYEGKRHVKTVPVRLLRSQNTARRSHKDTRFCAALIRNIKEIVSLLGSKSVLVISQDDKTRVPFVELPDHDWVVAERHKLILLVYAILDVQEGRYEHADAVTYLGPTFIRVHSDKHDSSTAYSHGKDFDDLMNERKLHNYTTTIDEQPKPVVVLLTDGGPDENPHYKKTVQMMIEHFDTYDLDTIIVACFAPHQNAQLRTNDKELEKRNFKAAGDVLASIWENTVIDNYLVLIKYVEPSEAHYCPNEKSEPWIEKHVMTCCYFIQ